MESNNTSPSTSGTRGNWNSLVERSIAAWNPLNKSEPGLEESVLRSWSSLDEFLRESAGAGPMFWFFQTRGAFLSQKTMTKWNRLNLDDYVLLPATNGCFVRRDESFFISHFWHSATEPDPGGKYLKLLQHDLRQQEWSYVWLDWTCAPQHPRTEEEDRYFGRTLQTMTGIIRNSGFGWYYPPFEPRLWILYEVAMYLLTSTKWSTISGFPDMQRFLTHVLEMVRFGVKETLDKHGYRCSYARDKEFLTSRLELLVLLRRIRVHIDEVRVLMDYLTWHPSTEVFMRRTMQGDNIELCLFEGTVTVNGDKHTFTPFPRWPEHDTFDDSNAFIKRSGLNCYESMRGSDWVPRSVLEETLVMEQIGKSPHPYIIKYHGCRVCRGRITSLVLELLNLTLTQYAKKPEFKELDKAKFLDGVESAAKYLHSLGLAHNDINPDNIMVKDGMPVLIDFGSCQKFGERLQSLGTPGWYEELFYTSEKKHDIYGSSGQKKTPSHVPRFLIHSTSNSK